MAGVNIVAAAMNHLCSLVQLLNHSSHEGHLEKMTVLALFLCICPESSFLCSIEMSVLYYHKTLLPPTAVSHSCYGHFTSRTDKNLIIAKHTIIQIYRLTGDLNFELMYEAPPVMTKLSALEMFRPRDESQDVLILGCLRSNCTRYTVHVLVWVADKIVIRDEFQLRDSGPQMCLVHPQCQMIALVEADTKKSITFLPLGGTGKFGEPFLSSLDATSKAIDVKFLRNCHSPTLVVLYQSAQGSYFIKTYLVPFTDEGKERMLRKGPWFKPVNFVADGLISVPGPFGGVLAVGSESIAYCSNSANIRVKTAIKKTVPRTAGENLAELYDNRHGISYEWVMDYKLLIADPSGLLHLLVLTHDNHTIAMTDTIILGKTSISSTISYLGGDYAYIGSLFGNSQAIKLNISPDKNGSYGGAGFELKESFESLGPISDFCMVDVEGQNQREMVACAGTFKDGFIHVLRHSTYLNEVASLEQSNISGIWSLIPAPTDHLVAKFLVISFGKQTIVLGVPVTDSFYKKTQIDGFCSYKQTIFCHDAVFNQYVQVTTDSVRLICALSKKLIFEWKAGATIYIATANKSQVLVATIAGKLFSIGLCSGSLKIEQETYMPCILCIDMTPIGDQNYSELAAVGLETESDVQILSLPHLELKESKRLDEPAISALLCALEGKCYLFCATLHGEIFHFDVDVRTGELKDKTILLPGMRQRLDSPRRLVKFTFANKTEVFLGGCNPCVLHSLGKKLLCSYVNLKEVGPTCFLDASNFPYSLAVVTENMLKIMEIESVHQVHVHRSVSLREPAHRICYQKQSRTYSICSVRSTGASELNFFHVLDSVTLQVLGTHSFRSRESGVAIVSCLLADDPQEYYCVVTQNADTHTNDSGRILVFLVKDAKLGLVSEVEIEEIDKISHLSSYKGDLIVGGERFYQFKWKSGQLVQEGRYRVRTLDRTVWGCRLRIYKVADKHELMNNVAISYHDTFLSAVEELDYSHFLFGLSGAHSRIVIGSLTYALDEAKLAHLLFDITDELCLHEHVTHFCQSSFSIDFDGKVPSIIYSTRSGRVGIIGLLPYEDHKNLLTIQESMQAEFFKYKEDGVWCFVFCPTDGHFLDGDMLRRNELEAFL